jgi:hypothetical protein
MRWTGRQDRELPAGRVRGTASADQTVIVLDVVRGREAPVWEIAERAAQPLRIVAAALEQLRVTGCASRKGDLWSAPAGA